jgi:hypothetical protein
MEPTGRANVRPMMNSAKSGAISQNDQLDPDGASLHPLSIRQTPMGSAFVVW